MRTSSAASATHRASTGGSAGGRSLFCAGEQELVADGTFDGLAERLTVAATVARLRSRCREVLRRYYFEGDRTDSIAAAIDTSARNVIYLLHICRNRARQIYEQLTRVR